MQVRIIGDRLSVELFRLAGIEGQVTEDAAVAGETINTYMRDPEIGAILVTTTLADRLGNRFRELLQRRSLPLILRVPDRYDRDGEAASIRDYLQKTLGIRV